MIAPSTLQLNMERLWPDHFKDPPKWWDNQNKKVSGNIDSTDFMFMTTREAISIDNCKPLKLEQAGTRKQVMTIGRGCFCASSDESAVPKRSPQLNEVKDAYAQMMKAGNKFRLFEANTLMDKYVKCGSMVDARCIFDNMPKRSVVSWNVMILGYAKQEEGALALELYAQMQQNGFQQTERTYVAALKACSSLAALEEAKQVDGKLVKTGCLVKGRDIHSQVVKSGFQSDIFVGNTMLDMYVNCGSIEDAWHVFDELSDRDVVSWNTMILGCAKWDESARALELYADMHLEGILPDYRTFIGALKACIGLAALEEGMEVDWNFLNVGCLEKGRTIHFNAVKSGFDTNIFVGTVLVDMYTKCGSIEDARHVFDELPYRNVVSWNTMISGYAIKGEGALAFELYARMHQEGIKQDHRTFVGGLKACSILGTQEEGTKIDGRILKVLCLEKGRAIHSQVLKSGIESDAFIETTLVDMYTKCWSMEDARHVFDESLHHDVVSWTAMISGYAQRDEGLLALELYVKMYQEGVIPDQRMFVGALNACSSLAAIEEGKHVNGKVVKIRCLEIGRIIQSQIVKSGFELDVFVGTTVVDMYVKCGSMEDAHHAFDVLPYHNVVAWNAMLSGYGEQGESEQVFKLYALLQEQGASTNNVTFINILKTCGNTGALETGKEVHAQICRVGLETTVNVATTVIDMYAKCGSMNDAQQLFDALPVRSLIMWNALIAGYARQGECEVVFHLFERMRQEGIQPDGLTFLGILTVCSHVGLLHESQKYFQNMNTQYGLIPTVEHYNCMIDLLGRAGQVKDAMEIVEKMPFQADVITLSTILSACRMWKNMEVGKRAFEYAVRLDNKSSAPYVLMSNIYAHAQMWDHHDKIQVVRNETRAH